MKHYNITILLTLLICMIGAKAFAYDIEVANSDGVTICYSWINNNTELAVSGLSNKTYIGDVVIPEQVTYNGKTYSVTEIGSKAFYKWIGLTSITIPNSVLKIGEYAFGSCYYLMSVIIGNSVREIDYCAFYYCDHLQSIYCLNPIPPIIVKDNFECGSSLRNTYDIYNYAILHVPMGSGEAYSGAYEWRYFKRIKEDMEMNGKVYYANLTVRQGTTGYTRSAVKAAEKQTIYIGSLGQNKVNAVTFNGEDVTNQVKDGYYTTPEIMGESVLSVSYEVPSEVRFLNLSNVKVTGYNGEITISNIDEPSEVSVYTVDGKRVGYIPNALGTVTLQVAPDQLYVVKVGSRIYKVAL